MMAEGAQSVTLQQKAPECDVLEISKENLLIELDYFSRSFDREHYTNAMKIYTELGK